MDLSSLSDTQLQALYGAGSSSPDVSKMSDADLMAAYHGPSYAEDAAKSVGAGLAGATAFTLGAAGDLRNAASAATDWAGGKLGVSPDKVQQFKDIASRTASLTGPGAVLANAPTSRQIIDSAPNPIVSPDYK